MVVCYNCDVVQGVDWEFVKGGNSYNWVMGDLGYQFDVCNVFLFSVLFYVIKFYIGDLGILWGLVIIVDVQVVNI